MELTIGVAAVSKKWMVTPEVAETGVQGKVLVTSDWERCHRSW